MPTRRGTSRARRGSSRNRNFVAIPVQQAKALGTLADATVLAQSLIGTLTEDMFAISADLLWTIRDLTPGEGPVYVGVAHGDYSVSEIKESLEVTLTGPGSKIEQERARRMIRTSGVFPGLTSEESLNLGVPLRTRMKFTVQSAKALNGWIWNSSGAALTTGAIVEIAGKVYGKWLV